MAEKSRNRSAIFLVISPLFFIISATTVHCRSISPKSVAHTATLDVAAALERTGAVLSLDHQTKQSLLHQEELRGNENRHHSTAPGSASLRVRLHPRESLQPPAHADYRSLTLARLARDDARVRAINARLELAIHGVKRSDLTPLIQEEEAVTAAGGDGLSGPVVSGTSQGSGEYFSRVGIGRPARLQYMVLDTGSDVTWAQCQPCADCYQQADPFFDPAASSTYSPLSCGSSQCRQLDVSACRNGSCLYQVSYGDGSYTVGDFATDTITLGGASVPGIAFGCGHDNEGFSATSFSYCLVDRDSTSSSTLEFGSGAGGGDAAVSAPLLRNRKLDTFYYVGFTGISVGGRMLSIPPSSFSMGESGEGGVIVDSGTAVTRLQSDAYASLRNAFTKGTAGLPPAMGVALFDTCYDLSGRDTVEVPAVSFQFPNYLIPVDSFGTFCLAFAPTSSGLSIIGNVQQQGTRVGFDLANSLVSFSPHEC
ncbi:unnamed protein product [Spirodela intermedia]|uniref:Peptidase A1 domain-containing protein n=1 Tax=Spirodela intermedia TaxID=51605 RepID=A0A7I8J5B4_SPIIN|nr:unnamed protein product [Spirodela intermedia]CAA6665418.1 unnamed protein product [Spirodela intermedia]